jgi:hypothetical protein
MIFLLPNQKRLSLTISLLLRRGITPEGLCFRRLLYSGVTAMICSPSGISVDLYIVTPDYLRTMAIPLRAGRPLTERDTEESPKVALINETMARALWPKQDPLGKRVKFPGSERNPQPWRTIVGVVADVAQYALDRQAPMQIYLAEAQYPASFMTLVVRTASDPAGFAPAVRNEARALTRLIKTMLFGVSARDPLTFIAISALLTVVALMACWIPARRATKVDPLLALRRQ